MRLKPQRLNSMETKNQQGQASVLGIALCLILISMTLVLYNTGQATTEKSRLVNAADAAAYSSAVHVARNLNYVAYANRAVMANHLAVGHLTAFVSWTAYVADALQQLSDYLGWVPYIGQVITYASNIWDGYDEIVEGAAPKIASAASGINKVIYASQLEAELSLTLISVQSLQDTILASYGSTIARAHVSDAATLAQSSTVTALALENLGRENVELMKFLKWQGYSPDDDDGLMLGLIQKGAAHSVEQGSPKDWLKASGARGWGVNFSKILRAGKTGSTTPTSNNGTLGWKAEDSIGVEAFKDLEWGNVSAAEGDADTAQWSYQGISRYINVKDTKPTENIAFSTTVIATNKLTSAKLMALGPQAHDKSSDALFSVACGEAYFFRPNTMSLSGDADEYANVFNPFWKARLKPMSSCGDNVWEPRS